MRNGGTCLLEGVGLLKFLKVPPGYVAKTSVPPTLMVYGDGRYNGVLLYNIKWLLWKLSSKEDFISADKLMMILTRNSEKKVDHDDARGITAVRIYKQNIILYRMLQIQITVCL